MYKHWASKHLAPPAAISIPAGIFQGWPEYQGKVNESLMLFYNVGLWYFMGRDMIYHAFEPIVKAGYEHQKSPSETALAIGREFRFYHIQGSPYEGRGGDVL